MTNSINESNITTIQDKNKNQLMTILALWFFTGILGGHRYYLGDYKRALLMTFTFGEFLFWTVLDFFFILKQTLPKMTPVESHFIHSRWYTFANKCTFICILGYSLTPLHWCLIYIFIGLDLYNSYGIPSMKEFILYIFIVVVTMKIIMLPMYVFFVCLYGKQMGHFPFLITLLHLLIGVLLLRMAIGFGEDTLLLRHSIYVAASLILLTGLYRFILYLIVARRKEDAKRN